MWEVINFGVAMITAFAATVVTRPPCIYETCQTSIPVIDGQRLETELNGHFRGHRALHERRTGAVGGAAKIHHVGVAPKIRFLFEQQPIEVGTKIRGGQPSHAASNDDVKMSCRLNRTVLRPTFEPWSAPL